VDPTADFSKIMLLHCSAEHKYENDVTEIISHPALD